MGTVFFSFIEDEYIYDKYLQNCMREREREQSILSFTIDKDENRVLANKILLKKGDIKSVSWEYS